VPVPGNDVSISIHWVTVKKLMLVAYTWVSPFSSSPSWLCYGTTNYRPT